MAQRPDANEVLWTKICVYSLIILYCIVLVIIAPKRIFNESISFKMATSMAITSDDNLLLYDYKVYSTEDRFNKGFIYDLEEVKKAFKDRKEIFAVKIQSDSSKVEILEEYILIHSPEVPELNIEYYLVENMIIANTSISCRTFIILLQDIIRLINNIYIGIVSVVFILVLSPTTIKLSRNIGKLVKEKNKK